MSLRVYSSLTQQKELFRPVTPGKVRMYLCGPTVYKPPHVGHMVGPVIFDTIKRYLQFKGFEVTWVVNITDVEDKLIASAAEEGADVKTIAEKYTRQYLDCLALLGIDTIDRMPKASEHIAEIIALNQRLIETRHAYVSDGNVWFDVASDPDYGKLSHRKVEDQEAGTRDLEGAGKRRAADFALWKAAKPGEPAWDSPWGQGRPGWHIECSAMSMKYLGETFDIHGGGLDLLFPHHENELAQSQCATGKPFARYWLHNGLTRIRTKAAGGEWRMEKQSKSLGNVIDVQQFLRDSGPELLRYLLLSTHYRSPIDFTEDTISAAGKGLASLQRLLERVERLSGQPLPDRGPDMDQLGNSLLAGEHAAYARSVLGQKMKFLEMMDDDFNTAGAIAVLHELSGLVNSFIDKTQLERQASKPPPLVAAAVAGAMTLKNLGSAVLGLFRVRAAPSAESAGGALVEGLVQLLIQLRSEARQRRDFALADTIRKGLAERGITLEDRPDGTIWRA